MKKKILLNSFLILVWNFGNAQTMETLQYNGDINKYINIVILGDGYTSSQQSDFISDATNLTNYLFTQSPWSNYKNYFNVFAIEVISNESGAKHLGTTSECGTIPISNPSTYFGSEFDYNGMHRLVVPTNTTNIVNVLSTIFPYYDQVLMIVNTPHYGGSGGGIATSTNHSSSNEITAHELGHSFAGLADEYYAGDTYAGEKPNMTQQTNAALVKWENWMGINGIGIYQHCCGGQSASWYRPQNNCKMQNFGVSYCNVCTEAIIEKIHSLVNIIVSYTPTTMTITSPNQYIDFNLSDLMKPIPNTLNIEWKLDGVQILNNVDSIQIDQNNLEIGMHTLTATVEDNSSLINVNNHYQIHFCTITWTIIKTTLGVQLMSNDNKISISAFPNPTNSILNISIESDKPQKASMYIISFDGRKSFQLENEIVVNGKYLNTYNVEHLSTGFYTIVFKIGDVTQTQKFIKQ